MSYKYLNITNMSFVKEYVQKRTSKNVFFRQVNTLVDWSSIEKELRKVYKRGEKERGCKAYHPLILFKMQLIIDGQQRITSITLFLIYLNHLQSF